MLLDSIRLWIFVCVLSVDFLCDGYQFNIFVLGISVVGK